MNFLFNSQNHLFELARSGKRLPHWLAALVLSVVFMLIAQIGGGIVAVMAVMGLSMATGQVSTEQWGEMSSRGDQAGLTRLLLPDTALEQVIFLVFIFGPIFLILWAWLALVEKRPLWSLGLERRRAWFYYGRGLLVGLAMFAAAVGLSAALGYMTFENDTTQPVGWAALGGALLVFLGWTVQGPAEEALTRGWLLGALGARYKPWLGVVISSVVFAAFHSFNDNLSPLAVLNLFLFGLFAALYALYEGSLWGVFSIHAVWNWAQGHVFGLAVSGGVMPGGALLNLMEVGPDFVTGGAFGPEGGLAVTVVLAVSCALVWQLSRRKTSMQP